MPLDSPWESWNMRHMVQLSSSLERRWNLGFLTLLLCAELGGGAMTSAYMPFMPPHSQRFSIWDPFLSVLRFRQDRNQPPGNPPQKSEHWNLVQSSSSPSRENLGVGHLPSIMQYCAGGGIIVREHLNFSYQL